MSSPAVPEEGCALCGSTWGDHWEEVDGRRRFFCCWICARAYENMVEEVKARTGWDRVEAMDIVGDFQGREVTARRGDETFAFRIAFDSETGEIRAFRDLSPG